ncbi:2-amino-4-hydroxy-6-hydroxymethyldihydropteridine diphosphokinase [Desulfitobacterium sp. THU1]|uniref:2-amino-4-hydroxy-6- hydroxymethyldihydropteridine diphosphokinase n=1 Tax=Desulfitobacterium sp. THU1 TaxID=3138072 RepID=UPI00311FA56C
MKAYLGLGSNLGDRGDYLAKSRQKLMAHPDIQVLKQSSIYETKPWGKTDQSDFWNQVLEIETSLAPLALLDYCQEVESSLGRERLIHWGPRTIDIDLLNYDNRVWEDQRLILPHPRMEQREFVLAPLREIAPELILPSGRRVTEVIGEGTVWRLEATDNS